jgi:hypothetical protein
MEMGIFTQGTADPSDDRDSSLDGDVVFHEYGHGVSSRLIGGSSGSGCLSGTQSGAMGEGWSDYWACTYYGNGGVGEYVVNSSTGIRRAVYSVPASFIHDSYADLGNQGFEVHRDGEIWAAALWDLRQTLGSATSNRIILDGMRFTPCAPSFLNARDGILQADQSLNGGANRCRIWTVFARHGMGNSATGNDGFTHNAQSDMPASCAVYEGYHEGADCSQVWGWAWDQNNPNTPINVDIYDNITLIATVPANLFRQDLFNAGKGNGYHAFVFNLPSYLKDGQSHQMRVRFPGTLNNLTWTPRSVICKATIFTTQTPQTILCDPSTWEEATQFSSTISGYITHIRFYKVSGEGGTHIGRLWSDTGAQLAQTTFTNESLGGWQEQALPSPVPITAGVRYRVSYNMNSCLGKTFSAMPITNGPLTAHAGYYSTPSGTFPNTSSSSNFFADVRFSAP